MKVKQCILTVFCSLFFIQPLFSETIQVGLEPLPPLIVSKTEGLTVQMLKKIEGISDLKFNIKIMPYNRAKKFLKDGQISLMGHTPHRQETKEFYTYGKELNWSVPTMIDIYGMKKANVTPTGHKNVKNN